MTVKKKYFWYKTLRELDKAFHRKVNHGWNIKDIHISQCPYDQPHVVLTKPHVELHMYVICKNSKNTVNKPEM